MNQELRKILFLKNSIFLICICLQNVAYSQTNKKIKNTKICTVIKK
jgi:hypothetical protein